MPIPWSLSLRSFSFQVPWKSSFGENHPWSWRANSSQVQVIQSSSILEENLSLLPSHFSPAKIWRNHWYYCRSVNHGIKFVNSVGGQFTRTVVHIGRQMCLGQRTSVIPNRRRWHKWRWRLLSIRDSRRFPRTLAAVESLEVLCNNQDNRCKNKGRLSRVLSRCTYHTRLLL